MNSFERSIRTIVADDHPLMAEAISRSLDEHHDIELVGVAGSVAAALDLASRTQPDVAVLDMRLGDGDALSLLPRLAECSRNTNALIWSSFDDVSLVRRALGAGARGYLAKTATTVDLQAAVIDVGLGARVLAPALQDALIGAIGEGGTVSSVALSHQERSALQFAAKGFNEREMAAELGVSVSSVKSYLRRSYDKLGAQGRTEAVVNALRQGLIA